MTGHRNLLTKITSWGRVPGRMGIASRFPIRYRNVPDVDTGRLELLSCYGEENEVAAQLRYGIRGSRMSRIEAVERAEPRWKTET